MTVHELQKSNFKWRKKFDGTRDFSSIQTSVWLSKIRSVHTYVMPRTVYFGWICITNLFLWHWGIKHPKLSLFNCAKKSSAKIGILENLEFRMWSVVQSPEKSPFVSNSQRISQTSLFLNFTPSKTQQDFRFSTNSGPFRPSCRKATERTRLKMTSLLSNTSIDNNLHRCCTVQWFPLWPITS